ncbi:response regulator [Candidatus Saccharibacteria bacterium]|nr:response regulator [Candidatus Saccharibacteria bacterium]
MIFVIDDNAVMAKCVAKVCTDARREVKIFNNMIEAMAALEEEMPELILMNLLVTGPDGVSFLNEISSYEDTGKIPVVVLTDGVTRGWDLGEYGVVGMLDTETMRPEEIRGYVEKYTK